MKRVLHISRRHLTLSTVDMFSANNMGDKIATRFKNQRKSIWVEINKQVAAHKPLNLGQGFPNYGPPHHVQQSLADTALGDNSMMQYTRAFGHPRLINALAKLYSPMINKDINPLDEILVSVGAYGALYTSINSMMNPGDEAIIIEPYFDCYVPMVETAGGKALCVPMKMKDTPKTKKGILSSYDYYIDEADLEAVVTKKTKLLIINTPNNPSGKVLIKEELETIANFCKRHDLICISDEVYEWMVYPPFKHIKIASLPDMWDRTLTIGSAGKTFSVTGWKLGWTIGPSNLMEGLRVAHQNCVYTCPTPTQEAVARSLETEMPLMNTPESYWKQLCVELQQKRNRTSEALMKAGLTPIIPDGSYFIMADISNLKFPGSEETTSTAKDVIFNNWMIQNKKLCGIPTSCFFIPEHQDLGEKYIRFCFFKTDEVLEEAYNILNKWAKDNAEDSK